MSLAIVTVSSISSLRRLNKGRLRMKRHLLLGITLVTLAMQSPRLLAEENSAAVAIIAAVRMVIKCKAISITSPIALAHGSRDPMDFSEHANGLVNLRINGIAECDDGTMGRVSGRVQSRPSHRKDGVSQAAHVTVHNQRLDAGYQGKRDRSSHSCSQIDATIGRSMRKDLEGAYVFMPRSNRGRTRRGGGPGDIPNGNGRRSNSRPPAVEQPVGLEEAMDPIDPSKLREVLLDAKVAGLISSSMDELLLTGGLQNISWEKIPTVPSIQLQKSQYDEITGMLEKGESVELNFDIRNFFRKGPIPLYNVMADIPGTKAPRKW